MILSPYIEYNGKKKLTRDDLIYNIIDQNAPVTVESRSSSRFLAPSGPLINDKDRGMEAFANSE